MEYKVIRSNSARVSNFLRYEKYMFIHFVGQKCRTLTLAVENVLHREAYRQHTANC